MTKPARSCGRPDAAAAPGGPRAASFLGTATTGTQPATISFDSERGRTGLGGTSSGEYRRLRIATRFTPEIVPLPHASGSECGSRLPVRTLVIGTGGREHADRCRGEGKTCVVPDTETAPQTGYAPVNGLRMYYEVHGTGGSPLLLLHGGLFNIDLQFGQLIPGLPADRRQDTIQRVVIVPDQPVAALVDGAGPRLGVDHEHPTGADDQVNRRWPASRARPGHAGPPTRVAPGG
jgi:hypothetical protein